MKYFFGSRPQIATSDKYFFESSKIKVELLHHVKICFHILLLQNGSYNKVKHI